jgi:hypothetical protein
LSTAKKPRGGHPLTHWIGLVMIAAALVLALALSLYVGRVADNSGPQAGSQGGVAQEGADNFTAAREAVESSLQRYGNPNLEVVEVIEFANNYCTKGTATMAWERRRELRVDRSRVLVHQEFHSRYAGVLLPDLSDCP